MGSYVRYANKEDADTIALIYSKSFQQAFKGIIPDDFLNGKFSFENLRKQLAKELDEGTTSNCIILKDDIPVGMLTFMKDSYKERDESEIDLGRIYLLPEYWGKNVAIEFINWLSKELKSKGYSKVALWVVEENLRARKFYEKVGFAHDGEIRIINPGREIKEYRYTKQL